MESRKTSRSDDRYASSLPSSALLYTNVRTVGDVAAVTAVIASLIAVFASPSWKLPALVVLGGLALAGIAIDLPLLNRLAIRHTSYAVDADAVRIRRGVLITRDTTIATAQILNVEIVDGPLLRRHGLVKVRFACIALIEPLGPVTPEEADRIRDQVLAPYFCSQERPGVRR